MADDLTEAEFLGNEEDDPGFYGTGLIVSRAGEMALAILDGGLANFEAFRISDAEASSLALMIQAVIG